MKSRLILATLLACALGTAPFVPAFAMGGGGDGGGGSSGGGSSSGGSGKADQTIKKCKKGEVRDKRNKKCVRVSYGILPDEDLYQQGAALAQAGEYDWGLAVLAAIRNQNDPRVLNYTGYSLRKSGRLDEAIGKYRKALAINPNFVLAREYLGEGYVAAGRLDLAKAELTEIAGRCGTTCEEYQELAEHIDLVRGF
jgi:tetratricopeptide (TPR) repeat protein